MVDISKFRKKNTVYMPGSTSHHEVAGEEESQRGQPDLGRHDEEKSIDGESVGNDGEECHNARKNVSSRRRRLGTSAECDGQWVWCERGTARNVPHHRIRKVTSWAGVNISQRRYRAKLGEAGR